MNNQTMFYLVLFILVFGVCLLFSLVAHKCDNGHFDEMQEMYRDRSYKIAHIVTISFLGIYFIYDYILGDTFYRLSSSLLALVALVIGLTAYIAYSVWNNAYIHVNKKGTGFFIFYAAIAFISLLSFIMELDDINSLFDNNTIQCNSIFVNLATAIIFGVAPVVFFVKKGIDKMEK